MNKGNERAALNWGKLRVVVKQLKIYLRKQK